MENFDYFHRKLMRATVGFLYAALGVYLLTLFCAVLGFGPATASFYSVTLSLALVFGVLFVAFLLTSLVRALVHFLMHQRKDAN